MPDDSLDIIQSPAGLVADVRSMIDQTREGVARTVNAGMTLLYWRIGKRIHVEVLGNERAGYGEEIVATLSRQLMGEFGNGFSEKSLRRMVQFADVFSEGEIVATLSRQLGWSHFKEIIPFKDALQRDFYAEMCRIERWSVRTLREKIQSMLYERTAISRQPEEVAKAELAKLRDEDQLTPALVFKDPYILDFLGLRDRYLEKTSKTPSSARSNPSSLNSAMDLPSSPARNASRSIRTTSTSISSSITAASGVSSPSTLSSATSRPSTKGRWNSISTGSPNTSSCRKNNPLSASSSEPGKRPNRSNSSNSANPASTSPTTSPPCRPANYSNRNSTPPSNSPARGLRGK